MTTWNIQFRSVWSSLYHYIR